MTWVPFESMNYCRSNLKLNKPLTVTDLVTNEEVITDKWSMICYDIKDLDKESIAFLKKRGIEQVKLECAYKDKQTKYKGKKDKTGARVRMLKSRKKK